MYKVLGTSEEVTSCEKCGKSNLKKTVVLQAEDGGEVFFGVDCAAAAVWGSKRYEGVTRAAAAAVDWGRRVLAVQGPEKAAAAVWNKYGLPVEAKGGRVLIWAGRVGDGPTVIE